MCHESADAEHCHFAREPENELPTLNHWRRKRVAASRQERESESQLLQRENERAGCRRQLHERESELLSSKLTSERGSRLCK